VTHAMHLFGDKIKQAIFIAATMLPFGYQTEQDIKDVIQKISTMLSCHNFVQVSLLRLGIRNESMP
jgi:hypothetical protein